LGFEETDVLCDTREIEEGEIYGRRRRRWNTVLLNMVCIYKRKRAGLVEHLERHTKHDAQKTRVSKMDIPLQ